MLSRDMHTKGGMYAWTLSMYRALGFKELHIKEPSQEGL
jgi:hypothetical protein